MKKKIQKQMKGNRGITLVALVVTIVVLLILAGITISTLFGDNGIISAARRAADDTKQDEINTDQGIKDLTDKMNNEIDGSLSASLISKNASKYYGKKVNNYVAGVTGLEVDWKIFYADSNHIYLIASDYIPNDKLPASTNASGTVTTNKPSATTYYQRSMDFTPILNDYTGSARVSDNVKYLNKSYFDYLTTNNTSSTNDNMKVVAYMLDTKAWEGFKDSSGKADFVIGGPTVEMLFDSYCQKNNLVNSSGKNKYQARVTDIKGYEVSSDYGANWSPYNTFLSDLSTNDSEQLYVISSRSTGWFYWLASPSTTNADDGVHVYYDGYVTNGRSSHTNAEGSVRPLIALKSNVSLVEQEDGSFNIK